MRRSWDRQSQGCNFSKLLVVERARLSIVRLLSGRIVLLSWRILAGRIVLRSLVGVIRLGVATRVGRPVAVLITRIPRCKRPLRRGSNYIREHTECRCRARNRKHLRIAAEAERETTSVVTAMSVVAWTYVSMCKSTRKTVAAS